uniref:Glutamyl/glutaminyl-tRNA synthetase class Ib catalytic domain-containing protein n=1 Tax=Setaria digitata TaxID=48799 RepID=A0A915Q7Y3_9BILA
MRCLSYDSRMAKEIRLVVRISGDHLSLEGLRRALYNFLFARANNGKFILQLGLNKHGRQPRGRKIEALLDRYGLERDEGPGTGGPFAPYSVVKRLKTYADAVERLIDTGLAYRCFCCGDTWKEMDPTKKEPPKLLPCSRNCFTKIHSESKSMALDGLPHVVRLRISDRTYQYQDVVQGKLSKRLPATDYLLLRPDFTPTSFFADTVDGHTLSASHHVTSSPLDFLQLPIYNALEWCMPIFINIGSLRLRSGSRLLTYSSARSYVRTYASIDELSVLNFLLARRGLRKSSVGRLYSIDEMVAHFDVNTIATNTLLLNTYNLMKPGKQETLLEQELELDEEVRLLDMCGKNFFNDMEFSNSITKNEFLPKPIPER